MPEVINSKHLQHKVSFCTGIIDLLSDFQKKISLCICNLEICIYLTCRFLKESFLCAYIYSRVRFAYSNLHTPAYIKYKTSRLDNNLDYTINWDILCRASHYSNTSKRCNLCIAEKFYILCKPECATLNKRNGLVSKCRHREKFLLRNVK